MPVMLAVDDDPLAVAWYQHALNAELRWDLGSVAGLAYCERPAPSGATWRQRLELTEKRRHDDDPHQGIHR